MTYTVYAIGAAILIGLGLHAAITRTHPFRRILALNVVSGGVFLFLIALSSRRGPDAVDPIPHALVLTGIVVAVSVSAFAVVIVRRIHQLSGRSTLDEGNLE